MKTEKRYSQKTIKFFYRNPEPHIERVLWYISYLHKKVWNCMLSICKGNFEQIDQVLQFVNPKGQEEIKKLKDFMEKTPPIERTFVHKDGTETVISTKPTKPLSEFGMLYCLGPIRNNDPELLQLSLNDLQKPCRVLSKSWKSFFELNKRGDKEARPPGYRNEEFFFTLQWEKPKIQMNPNGESFLSINHKIKGLETIQIPIPEYVANLVKEKVIRFVTIKRTQLFLNRPSDFEINLVYEVIKIEKKPIEKDLQIAGVDVGARKITLVRSSDPSITKTWNLPHWDRFFTKQRQKIEARMKTKTKGSRTWQKLFDVRTKLSKKWGDKQKDLHRKIAHEMIQMADVFYIGVTNVRLGLAQSEGGTKPQHRSVQNTGNLARIIRFLEEKAEETGKYVIKVPDQKVEAPKHTRKIIGAVRNYEYGLEKFALSS